MKVRKIVRKKGSGVFKVLMLVIGVVLVGLFTGVISFVPVTTLAKSRFHAKNNILFQKDADKLEKSDGDFDKQIESLRTAIQTHDNRDVKINGEPKPAPSPVVITTPAPVAAPKTAGLVVNDPRYDSASTEHSKQLPSDMGNGEYKFWVSAQDLKYTLPVVPVAGKTWKYSFSNTLVCAWGAPCAGASGLTQYGKPGNVTGPDRAKYNADDYIAQPAFQEEAVAYTGDGGILELGNSPSWVVRDAADGKIVSVGFNIRQSEKDNARGGGILTLTIE